MKSQTSPVRQGITVFRDSPTQREEQRMAALIDKCHQLTTAERALLKRKLREAQPQLLAVFNRHIRNTYSANLQTDLKKYLQASVVEVKNLRDRYIGRRAERFRLPMDYQRSCSNRQLVRSNGKSRVPSATHSNQIIVKPFGKATLSSHPTKASSTRHTLFQSVKSRLEFKNQAKECEVVERIQGKQQPQTRPDEEAASFHQTQSKGVLEKWSGCNLQNTSEKVTGLLSPAVLKTRLSRHDRELEASSIDIHPAEASADSSFRILNDLNHDFVLQLSQSQGWSMQDELIVVIDRLRENYAEDIVRVFFGSRSRSLFRQEFSSTLSRFYDFIGQPISSNCSLNFTELIFKGCQTITPTSLGRALQTFCPMKETKTRTIFNAINLQGKQAITGADIKIFFQRFAIDEGRRFFALFEQERSVIGQLSQFSYWDMYMMEDGRCWKQVWPALTVHPLL